MKKFVIACTLSTAVFLAFHGMADDDRKQTLRGEYTWVGDGSEGGLRAVFQPTGSGEWDVAFYFTFSGQPHTYRGTAAGSLSEGPLEGKVFNENRRRTFTFEGSFEDGTFRGNHFEVRRGRSSRLGTLTLRNRT